MPIIMDVPHDLINSHQKVRVFTDIMNVKKVPFLRSVCEGIRLRNSSHMTPSSKTTLKDAANKLIKICKNGGFNVKCIDADVKFECMQDEFEGEAVDIVDSDDHVEEVERDARSSKEGIRWIVQGRSEGCMCQWLDSSWK